MDQECRNRRKLKLDRAAAHGAHVGHHAVQVQPWRRFALDVPVVIATDKGGRDQDRCDAVGHGAR